MTSSTTIDGLATQAAELLAEIARDLEELLLTGLGSSVSKASRTLLSSIARRSSRLATLIQDELDSPVPDPSFMRRLVAAGRPVALASAVALAALTGFAEGATSTIFQRSAQHSEALADVCAAANNMPDEAVAYGLRIDGVLYVVASGAALVVGSEPARVGDGDGLAALAASSAAIAPSQLRLFVQGSSLLVEDLSSGESTYVIRGAETHPSLLPFGRTVGISCGDALLIEDHRIDVL